MEAFVHARKEGQSALPWRHLPRGSGPPTLSVAVNKGVGIVVMKSMGGGPLVATGAGTPNECLDYVWSLPVSTVIVGCDHVEFADRNAVMALRRGASPALEARPAVYRAIRSSSSGISNTAQLISRSVAPRKRL